MTATYDRPDPSDRTERRRPPTRSRMGEVWIAMIVAALVLLLLLIFILQNGQRAEVSFFGAHGSLPMGVALLLAAVFGVLLVALPGTARIIQLRMSGRRRATADQSLPPRSGTEGSDGTAPDDEVADKDRSQPADNGRDHRLVPHSGIGGPGGAAPGDEVA